MPEPMNVAPSRDLVSIIRRGAPRSVVIALVVGTFLTLVNQGTRVAHPDPVLGLRIVLTYLTPFVVSLLGWVLAERSRAV